jgi:hypothetical protein
MKEFISGEVVYVYQGMGQGDSDHGNAPWHTVGYFLTEAEAKEAVKSAGGWGTPGQVKTIHAIKSDDLYYSFEMIEISPPPLERLRQKALAKLTAEEKKALGL